MLHPPTSNSNVRASVDCICVFDLTGVKIFLYSFKFLVSFLVSPSVCRRMGNFNILESLKLKEG